MAKFIATVNFDIDKATDEGDQQYTIKAEIVCPAISVPFTAYDASGEMRRFNDGKVPDESRAEILNIESNIKDHPYDEVELLEILLDQNPEWQLEE